MKQRIHILLGCWPFWKITVRDRISDTSKCRVCKCCGKVQWNWSDNFTPSGWGQDMPPYNLGNHIVDVTNKAQ